MSSFFGREVDYDGTEILVKAGSRFPDTTDPAHYKSWLDGQIVSVRPMGYHRGRYIGYCRTLLRFPNVSYTGIGGRTQEGWSVHPKTPTLWDRLKYRVDAEGRYPWDIPGWQHTPLRKTRDWLIDLKDILNKAILTPAEYEAIYDFDRKSILTIAGVSDLSSIVKHEDEWARLSLEMETKHASITSGTYSIGSGLDYDDCDDWESAIGAQMDGDLTGEHADEETASAGFTLDTDTNGHLLKLTAAAGAEHNGRAYGNGARINLGTYDTISMDETNAGDLDECEISAIAIDNAGTNNVGVTATDGGDSGLLLIDRVLVKGDANCTQCLELRLAALNARMTNCIAYGASAGKGINAYPAYNTDHYYANNGAFGCSVGITQDQGGAVGTLVVKNNLAQGNTTDYVDDGGGWGTNGTNISEDATSPNASYQSKDCHAATSAFENYAYNSYLLALNGTLITTLDDGEDLSAVFDSDIVGNTRSTWYIGPSEPTWAGLSDGIDLSASFTTDIRGETRDVWYAGSYELVAVGGGAVTGTISISLAASGAIAGGGALSGSVAVSLTPSGALTGAGAASGTSTLSLTPSGALTGAGALSGTATAALTPSGSLMGTGAASGTATIDVVPSGAVVGAGALSGSAAVSLTPSGAVAGAGSLSGAATIGVSPSGALSGTVEASGTASISLTPSGAITGVSGVSGTATVSLTPSGSVAGAGAVSGSASVGVTPSGSLAGAGAVLGVCTITFTLSGSIQGAAIVSVPSVRIMIVDSEPRTLSVPSDQRVLIVEYESRTLTP